MMNMNESKEKPTAVLNFGEFSRRQHNREIPVLFAPFYQRIGGITMDKKLNLIGLSLAVGIFIGFTPNVVRVLSAVLIVSVLWNQWDEYCVNGGAKHE